MNIDLPKAPTPEENDLLLRKAKNGDMQAKDEFFLRNYRLVMYIAKKFQGFKGLSEDERLSASQLGFVKAYEGFDLSRDVKFATFATRCMENEILMTQRKEKRHEGVLNLETPVAQDFDGNEMLLVDMIPVDQSAEFNRIENKGAAADLINAYKKQYGVHGQRDLEMFLLSVTGELTQHELSDKYGITQSYISRILKKVQAKFQKIYERQLEVKMVKRKKVPYGIVSKLKWFFENTDLTVNEILEVMKQKFPDLDYHTVYRYKGQYNLNRMAKHAADLSAEELLPAGYKPKVVVEAAKEEQGEEKMYLSPRLINPDPKPPVKPVVEVPKNNEPTPASSAYTNKPKIPVLTYEDNVQTSVNVKEPAKEKKHSQARSMTLQQEFVTKDFFLETVSLLLSGLDPDEQYNFTFSFGKTHSRE
ncbi:RNA polymerase sigma-35 factor precursor [compost metagenome]